MEKNDIRVNNYINILANAQLRELFSQEDIVKMQIYVAKYISNDLQNINTETETYNRTAALFR